MPGVAAAQQPAQANARIAFDIPAQPLDAALARYFQLTGVQLLYDSSLTAGRRSSAVRGVHGPREALRLLLTGTGLVVRYSRANAAIITRADIEAEAPLVPLGRVVVRERVAAPSISPAERLAYYGQLETELRAALKQDRRTARLAFDVVLRLRIADDGRLNAIQLTRGSGDRKTDLALIEVLAKAVVTPPPALLEQPLAIALRGRKR